MVTWESNCMMMMEKKTRRAAAQAGLDGHLGEPGNQTMPTLVLDFEGPLNCLDYTLMDYSHLDYTHLDYKHI